MSEQQEAQQPVFNIEKIYVKDLSLEVPNAPHIFMEREAPQIDVQLHTESAAVSEGVYHSVLTVTVTAKIKDKTMFLVEASHAGIFQIRNIPQAEMEPILGIACPNILFPYVREVISDATSRAGFPPVMLNPMNFEVLYQQQQEQKQQQAGAAVTH